MVVNIDPISGTAALVNATRQGKRASDAVVLQRAADQGRLDEAARSRAVIETLEQDRRLRRYVKKRTLFRSKQAKAEFEAEVRRRLDEIPDEFRQAPKLGVALPALEAASMNWEEEQLREMYLNLLQRASDSQTAYAVHPSFVEVIRQLSADEANSLNHLLIYNVSWPIARMQLKAPGGAYRVTTPLVMNTVRADGGTPVENPMLPTWVTNWQRLGLMTATFDEWKATDDGSDPYAWVGSRPEWLSLQDLRTPAEAIHGQGEWVPDFAKGVLEATPYGKAFHAVVGAVGDSSAPNVVAARPATF